MASNAHATVGQVVVPFGISGGFRIYEVEPSSSGGKRTPRTRPWPAAEAIRPSAVEAIAAVRLTTHSGFLPLSWGAASSGCKVLVPALWYGPSPELDWLPAPRQRGSSKQADRFAVLVETTDDFTVAASSLSAGAATAIAELAGARERLRLAAETSLAGSGAIDPVDVLIRLREAALKTPDEWQLLVSLLWPAAPPSAAQAEALLSSLPIDRLRRTGLTDDSHRPTPTP